MSDTTTQKTVEAWVRDEWLAEREGRTFTRSTVPLTTGGSYEFDLVDFAESTIGLIATGNVKTAGGNLATAKIQHIRSGIYFMLLANAHRRLVILTDRGMHEWWLKEQQERKRVPPDIEFIHAELPEGLRVILASAQHAASREQTA